MLTNEWKLEDALKVMKEEGREEERVEIARSLLDILSVEEISVRTRLPISVVQKLKDELPPRRVEACLYRNFITV